MMLEQRAQAVADYLQRHDLRVVFAESCTAGLVSATLAKIPGISNWLCGSAVTYREVTKTQWLQVPEADLQQFTAVSEPVTRRMAVGVLERTPEADWSAAVTGHLGPNAPAELDGVVYIGVAFRGEHGVRPLEVQRFQLAQQSRAERLPEAAELVLAQLLTSMQLAEPVAER
jgi:PncC family amidohydrolase